MSSDSDEEIYKDELCKTLFDKSWEKIRVDFDPKSFMDKARTQGLLERGDIVDIEETKGREKKQLIVEGFQNKGWEGFNEFVNLLKITGQKSLAKFMTKLRDKELKEREKKQEEKKKTKEEEKKAQEPSKTFSDFKEESKFDGRIIEIKPEWFETTINSLPSLTEGKFGKVYKYIENSDLILEMREIPFQYHGDIEDKTRNCVYWGRLMHFAINPLLAMGLDTEKSIYYLVYPFFENGTLADTLDKDIEKLRSGGDNRLDLDENTRLRIIYQLVSAISFLHTEVEHFRSAVAHGNVRSDQIYLDKYFNARLTNFGEAKECSPDDAGIQKDIQSLGNVILELFLSELPSNDCAEMINNMDTLIRDNRFQIKKVWKAKRPREAMEHIAKQCASGEEIEKIKHYVQDLLEEVSDCDRIKRVGDSLCDVCVINPKMKDDIIGHKRECNLQLCVGCMRNSYLNPISCPKCVENIVPPIGHQWGALLIAGNDVEEGVAKVFSDDAKKVEKWITMKYPLAMGIRNEYVYSIMPSNPGQDENLAPKLQDKLEQMKSLIICENPKIQSLLIYFTGHYDADGDSFCLGREEENIINKSYLEENIKIMQNAGCKIIVLLDCCSAPRLEGEKDKPLIQLNSCTQEQLSRGDEISGSLFTKYLLKALGGKAMEEKCSDMQQCEICERFKSDNGFLEVHGLARFIDQHQNKLLTKGGHEEMKVMCNTDNVGWKDKALAYYIDKPLFFEFSLQRTDKEKVQNSKKVQLREMPDEMSLLKDQLFEELTKFHGLPMTGSIKNGGLVTITVKTGVKEKELVSMEQLAGAWNNKHDLIVKLRAIEELQLGRAGLLLPGDGILQILQQDFAKEHCQLKLDGAEKKVCIKVEQLSALYDHVEAKREKNPIKDLHDLSRSILQPVKNNKKIKEGMLVMTFPVDSDGQLIPNFMIVAVEESPKVLEPRSQGPTVLPSE